MKNVTWGYARYARDQNEAEIDVPGRVYEYFLSKFASAEGKLGGEFFTPQRS